MSTETHYSISIVIPVFNEADSLRTLHEQLSRALRETPHSWCEIIFVDDGSTDESLEVCRELHHGAPEKVRVVALRRNFGQTAAMAAGFDTAQGDVIIPMDADLQNDPADIKPLMEKLEEGYDVVSGWRANRRDRWFSRKLPSRIANALISWITGVHLHDYGCTLKAYHRQIVDDMNLYGELHRFLPALAHWTGARVTEVRVNHRPREHGNSKYGMNRVVRVLLDLITVKFLLSYSTKPMQVFGKWGLYAITAGGAFGAIAAGLKLFVPGHNVTSNPWMYLTIFFVLGGLQLLGMGLLGEINVRTYYESQHKSIYAVRERMG